MYENTGLMANSVDPDQMPNSAAFDVGLHPFFRLFHASKLGRNHTCMLLRVFELPFFQISGQIYVE